MLVSTLDMPYNYSYVDNYFYNNSHQRLDSGSIYSTDDTWCSVSYTGLVMPQTMMKPQSAEAANYITAGCCPSLLHMASMYLFDPIALHCTYTQCFKPYNFYIALYKNTISFLTQFSLHLCKVNHSLQT